jgi:hypothetical protein
MNRKAQLATIEADNPWFAADHFESSANPKRIGVHVNVKESAIVYLRSRHVINDHQMRAANRFRAAFEIVNGMVSSGGERVDNRAGSSLSDKVVVAARDLRICRDLLGWRSYKLLEAVCGYGYSFSEMMIPKGRATKSAADLLRASLDDMAVSWGYLRRSRPMVLTKHGPQM